MFDRYGNKMKLPSSPRAMPPVQRWHDRLDALIAWSTALSVAQARTVTAAAVVVAGLADFATGDALWFGPIYLLIICVPAWTLGWREAALTSATCVAVSLAANGLEAYPLGRTAIAWNMAMRILAVTIIIVLMSGTRRSHDREWNRARSDPLTGLVNEQAFYDNATAAAKGQQWGILAYVDLDGFKQINDRHGHAAGDEALQAFASGVRDLIRSDDVFARIGGDEFLLFLPVDSEAEGYELATTLHLRMNCLQTTFALGCSIGALVLDLSETAIRKDHVSLADRLMYEAKNEGGAIWIRTAGVPEDGGWTGPGAPLDHREVFGVIPAPSALH
ncbi:GGDEF domain-containing protein [Sphingomonas sp. PAMC26645]|uniref:GGDEF domain-containing protein n=1 Tax=Sphingomonas sp. PAMC26645 TaxID=2565555 RepID=UPI00109DEDF4|nr:GGDEF domain-containing protein [Sphingomonas sp. PAMC26645]QCB42673.1 GGDEF domain-containing protein [Sphingomonas sp. PAMC26645]